MRYRPLEANCPECGKPLRKDTGKAKYCCENSACSVVFVRNPDKQFMEIKYEARATESLTEQKVSLFLKQRTQKLLQETK